MEIEKATLSPMTPGGSPDTAKGIKVQFNPESLRVSRRRFGSTGVQSSNPNAARQASSQQTTGHGATMSVELFFDTSQDGADVLNTTRQIAALMGSSEEENTRETKVHFHWGTFIFIGTIDSMDETIDLFSEQGVPLRSTVSLSFIEGQIEAASAASGNAGAGGGAGAGFGLSAGVSAGVSVGGGISAGVSAGSGFSAGISAGVGTQPLTLARSGDTLQSLAARAGVDWKAAAEANNVDNPRQLDAGAVLNLNVSGQANASAGASVG